MACFSYVVLFAFFLLSSHLFARQLPNEKRFSISNKPLWAMPLTPTKITKAHSTAPSYGYYSRDSNLDSNPILPMLLFSKRKKPKEQLKTKTSPKTPPHQHKPPDQNPKTHHEHNPPHHEQVPLPHHPHHPYNPYNDYNDPPNYYERPRPFGSNLPPIGSIIEPFLRKPNQEDPESEDTDLESKKTDPKSKKNPPSNEEGEDSLDNTAHLIGYYLPLGFENFEKRFPTHNMMKANVLKGSTNNLQWRIPLTPSKVEKDHYTTFHRDYNVSPILEMLSRYPPSRGHKNKRKHKNKKPKHKKKQPKAENLPVSHSPPSPSTELHTPPAPHTDPPDEPRRIGPIDRPPSTWRKSYKEWVEWIKGWFNPNLKPPPNEEGSMDNTRSYQPSGFEDSVNHEDGNVVWHHKMNSPSDIYWRTTHSFPTKISP